MYFLIIFFYFFIILNYKEIFSNIKRGDISYFTLFIAYLFSFELLNRIVRGSPIVPTEYSKYIGVFIFGYVAFISKIPIHKIGITLIFLLLPGILYDKSGEIQSYDIVNNYFGSMSLAIGIGLWGTYKLDEKTLSNILKLLWLGSVSILITIFFKTPDYDDLNFSLSANMTTSGGTSSNQSSTILGLGMFLSFYSFFTDKKFSGNKYLDILFLMMFTFQGLLTFSRGGVLVGLLAILVFVFMSYISTDKSNKQNEAQKNILRNTTYLFFGFVLLIMSFIAVDSLTGGLLSLRYQGETYGTKTGIAEKDLNKITSGRSDILNEDIEIWLENPFFGGGAGSSSYLRMRKTGHYVPPHIEFSRLLSEHGILGLLYFIILLYLGFIIFLNRKKVESSDILLTLYFIGLATSFHAAMRTYVTPFLISISAVALSQKGKKIN